VTARTVYHCFERHPFTLGITFHAGETSITYPWGAGNHVVGLDANTKGYIDPGKKSTNAPDKKSFENLVNVLKHTASAHNQ